MARNMHGGGTGLLTLDFNDIDEPGAYVAHDTGLLVRVPSDGVIAGRSPAISLSGNGPVIVSRISNDPYIPVSKARCVAANHDLRVGF